MQRSPPRPRPLTFQPYSLYRAHGAGTGLREGCLSIPASGAHTCFVQPEVYIVEESERGGRRSFKRIKIRVTTSSEPAPAP